MFPQLSDPSRSNWPPLSGGRGATFGRRLHRLGRDVILSTCADDGARSHIDGTMTETCSADNSTPSD